MIATSNFRFRTPAALVPRLWLLGGAAVVLYLVAFVLPFPLVRWATLPPARDWPTLSGDVPLAGLALALAVGALFWCYTQALVTVRGLPWATVRGALLLPPLGAALLLALGAYPGGAIDLYTYISHTRAFLSGENPFLTAPDTLTVNATLLPFLGEWRALPSPYAPLMELLALPTGLAGAGVLWREMIAFKLWAVLPLLALPWPLRAALRARGLPESAGLLFILWNPLLLIEVAANGHNDGWLLLALAALFWAWATGRLWALVPLLAVGMMLKWVPALLAPLLLALLWRERAWGALLGGGLLGAVVVALSLGPVWSGLADLLRWPVFTEANRPGFSLHALALLAADSALPGRGIPESFLGVAKRSGTLLFAAVALATLWRLWQARWPLPHAAWWLLLGYLTVGALAFRPWYPAWLLVPATLAPACRPATVALTLTTQLAVLLYGFGIPHLGVLGAHLIAVPLTFGPAWWAIVARKPGLGDDPPADWPLPSRRLRSRDG